MEVHDGLKDLRKVIYTPESQIRNPIQFLRAMGQDVIASHELAWRLFVRDVLARYRQSILGIFWAFLPPIVTGIVFIILHSRNVVNFGATDIPYPAFALIGTTLWQLFTESLNLPLKTVITAKPMLAKINFPREALILSAFYQCILNAIIKLPIIVAVFIIFKVQIAPESIYALFFLLFLILLAISIGLLLTPIGVLYSDIQSGLIIITQLWFFITPVVYPPPQSFPFSLIVLLNPVSALILTIRELLTSGSISNPIPLFTVCMLAIISLCIAWIIFRIALPIIIERMSA